MLLQRGTFCEAYVAQARVFRTYSSWVLTMLLSKVRMIRRSFNSPASLHSSAPWLLV